MRVCAIEILEFLDFASEEIAGTGLGVREAALLLVVYSDSDLWLCCLTIDVFFFWSLLRVC